MAVTQNTYTGDGTTVLFSFTFPYLETTDIKVSVNGTNTTAYTLANATTIQFNTAPVNGAAIRIYRETDDSALAAAFYPGSAIRSADLNDNFTQNLYVTQESNRDATQAISTANAATTTANSAVATANGAVATANTASSNAAAAVATANTASSNASAAVSTANTASSNATTAVNTANAATATANSAAADAATAISTANSAVSTANSAVSTANSAVTTAGNAVTSANSAVSTATTASTNASNAVTTANAANSTAANALTTAGNAVTTANSAVSTANAADTKADQAINAVANALLFDIVANVAAIPASPSNNDAVEITNSTGIESFTPLSGLPAGFVGDAGLSVRLLYQSAGSTWTWLQYFPNDPDNRYAGPNTDAGTAAAPSIAFGPTDPNTGIFSPGADEFGIATGGVGRFFIDAAGNVVVATALSVNGEDVVVDNDTRLGPDFGAQNVTTTGTITGASLNPTSSTVPTNGVYLPAANSVAISTNGVGRIFVNDSGRLGVGTSSPSGLIHLQGASIAETWYTATNTGGATWRVGTADTASGLSGAYRIYDATNSSERLRVTAAGLVGIGTSSPSTKTHLYDASNVALKIESGGANYVETNFINTSAAYTLGIRPDTSNSLCIRDNTASATRVVLDSSGRLGIGTTSPARTLHVAGSAVFADTVDTTVWAQFSTGVGGIGTNNNYPFAFATNGTERARIDTSGRLLVGTSSARANMFNSIATSTLGIEAVAATTGAGRISVVYNDNSPDGSSIIIGKSRATSVGGSTVVQSGDALGGISWQGADGTELVEAASIRTEVDGTPGANDMPGRLVFSTTSDNASSPSERLRIASTGAFGLSGANYGSAGQVLTSQGSGAAPQWATAGGAWQFISSVTASNSASVAFTSGIDSTYDVYVVIARNVIPVNDQIDFYMRTSSNGGSSYDSGASDYYITYAAMSSNSATIVGVNAGATDKIFVETGGTDNDSGYGGLSFTMQLYNPSSSSTRKFVQFENVNAYRNDPIVRRAFGGGFRNSTSAVNAIQYYFSSGNISSGVFRLYGLKNS